MHPSHSRFQRENEEDLPPSYDEIESKEYQLMQILHPFVKADRRLLASLSQCSRCLFRLFAPELYRKIKVASSKSYSDYRNFQRFLSREAEVGGSYTQSLDVSAVRESMYSEIPGTWLLDTLIKYKNLKELILSGSSYLNEEAAYYFETKVCKEGGFPNLRRLDVSKTSISDQSLSTFVACFPNLEHLDLKQSCASKNTITAVGSHCRKIKSLLIERCYLEDQNVQMIEDNCWELEELVINECSGLSDEAFSHPSKSGVRLRLKRALFVGNSKLKNQFLLNFFAFSAQKSSLEELEIHGTGILLDDHIALQIGKSAPSIRKLSISASSLLPDMPHFPSSFQELRSLSIHNLSPTQNIKSFLICCAENCPVLSQINLLRDSYETDYIVSDMYAKATKSEGEITPEFVNKFNAAYGGKIKLSVLKDVLF